MQWGLVLDAWTSVWIGSFAAAILYGCYRAVEWRWPERYIGMHETFGLSSTETWVRFLAYRAVPYFLIVATTCVTVERVHGYGWLAAVVVWISGVFLTHGRVIAESLRTRRHEVNYAGYHLQMMLLLTIVISAAVWSTPWWAVVVPPPEEFLAAIWSALLVAGLGGFVIVTLRPRSQGSPWYGATYFIDRAVRDVGIDVLDWLFAECMRTGADPVMLKSILVVEVVQRPKWLRRIERLGVRIGVAKTSGAMQMTSSKPLSDRESVTLAAEQYAGVWSMNGGSGYLTSDLGQSWPVVARHNSDMSFIRAVNQVAHSLMTALPLQSYGSVGMGGRVLELRRYADKFALRGITRSQHISVLDLSKGLDVRRVEVKSANDDAWQAWEIEIPMSATTVLLAEVEAKSVTQVQMEDGEVASVLRGDLRENPVASPEPSAAGSADEPSQGLEAQPRRDRPAGGKRVWASRGATVARTRRGVR